MIPYSLCCSSHYLKVEITKKTLIEWYTFKLLWWYTFRLLSTDIDKAAPE